MSQVLATELPQDAFLTNYESREDVYTDCFMTEVPGSVSLETFVNAFFNTWLFRIERRILSVFAKKPSSDQDIANLASGASQSMAAWSVETRDEDQLLLEVADAGIRTWLMREDRDGGTRLYFGSAILPLASDHNGAPKMPFVFHALLRFHKLYARALLYLAKNALR